MKSDNTGNYYKPEIEEFHIGFEYEANISQPGNKSVWWKYTLTKENFVQNLDRIIEMKDDLRVKYLDKQDLIEFGCKYNPNKNEYIIEHDDSETRIEIMSMHPYMISINDIIYVIKNMSELKKVLTQII